MAPLLCGGRGWAVPGGAAWQRLLYLDLDVWTARSLGPFLAAAAPLLPPLDGNPELAGGVGAGRDSSERRKLLVSAAGGEGAGGEGAGGEDQGEEAPPRSGKPRRGKWPVRLRALSAAAPGGGVGGGERWLVLFEDCGAHALGWCAGCDAWNTGVMVLSRTARSATCLDEWRHRLEEGAFPTDQVARKATPAGTHGG